MFAKETYIQRRAELKKRVGSGILLFLGNNEVGMNYADNGYTFRQDSTFLYYFDSDYAGLCAIIDIDADKEIIFGNELTIDDIVWMGIQPTIHEKSQLVGVEHTAPLSELPVYLQKAQKAGQTIHFLPPYRGDNQILLQELLGIAPREQAAKASVPFIMAVADMRNHKTAEEIVEIEKSVDTSVDMHLTAMRMVRPGVTEREVAAAITRVAQKGGGELSFPIIASINGQTLHNHVQINTMQEGQMMLLDAGAEGKSHYAGDLSSTMPVGDHFTEQQKLIYNVLYNAHMAAVHALAPGKNFREVHLTAAENIASGLKDLGLVKGNPREVAESGAYALFMPCGLGHMMGLDVHDMESLGEKYVGYGGKEKSTQFGFKSLRLGRTLEPGFVFTMEPGIYFIPELIDKWRSEGKFTEFLNYEEINKWRTFSGIRNEEDYLITPDGYRRLGHKVKPMTIEEVEAQKGLDPFDL
jgi:Xaa-Pro aminopeptidase